MGREDTERSTPQRDLVVLLNMLPTSVVGFDGVDVDVDSYRPVRSVVEGQRALSCLRWSKGLRKWLSNELTPIPH